MADLNRRYPKSHSPNHQTVSDDPFRVIVRSGIAYAKFYSVMELDEFCDRYPHYFMGYVAVCLEGYYDAVKLGRLH